MSDWDSLILGLGKAAQAPEMTTAGYASSSRQPVSFPSPPSQGPQEGQGFLPPAFLSPQKQPSSENRNLIWPEWFLFSFPGLSWAT